jgi:hypothetical protein
MQIPSAPTVSRRRQVWQNGKLHQVGDAKVLLYPLPTALAKRLVALAVISIKIRHVLHHSYHRHSQLGKHADALGYVHKGQLLGGGHYHRSTE